MYGTPVQDNKRHLVQGKVEQRCTTLEQPGTGYGIQREVVKFTLTCLFFDLTENTKEGWLHSVTVESVLPARKKRAEVSGSEEGLR